jgi:hypothetical protein
MATYTVRKGRRYRATIALGLLQSVASNDMIADRFREAGFADVEVKGSGRTRSGHALWPHDDASADIPDEITRLRKSKLEAVRRRLLCPPQRP